MTEKFKDGAKKVGRGLMWAWLPMQALRSVQETIKSLARIGSMIRDGKSSPFLTQHDLTTDELADREAIRQGKEKVAALEAHERFEFFYQNLKWTEEALQAQKKAILRSHTIRLSMLLLVLLLMPALVFKFGAWTAVYCLSAAAYLATICVKSTCFFTQLEERAMWRFADLRARPDWWLLKRSLWFLE